MGCRYCLAGIYDQRDTSDITNPPVLIQSVYDDEVSSLGIVALKESSSKLSHATRPRAPGPVNVKSQKSFLSRVLRPTL